MPKSESRLADIAGPAVPVAVNVASGPATPVIVAVSVLLPGVAPSVQLPIVAVPVASVVAVAPVMLPLPGATANVTPTPFTGLPNWSVTTTLGAVVTDVLTVVV